jgi:hypothetical protein
VLAAASTSSSSINVSRGAVSSTDGRVGAQQVGGYDDVVDDGDDGDVLSSDEELWVDQDLALLKESMQRSYKRELSEIWRTIVDWTNRVDQWLLPYIGFLLFQAPERYFHMSRFAGLGTMLLAVVLGTFIAGGGKYGCAVFATVYPAYQTCKLLRSLSSGSNDRGPAVSADVQRELRIGASADDFAQWACYWILVVALEVAEQVVQALFFPLQQFHWLYWYVRMLVVEADTNLLYVRASSSSLC